MRISAGRFVLSVIGGAALAATCFLLLASPKSWLSRTRPCGGRASASLQDALPRDGVKAPRFFSCRSSDKQLHPLRFLRLLSLDNLKAEKGRAA